MCLADLAWARRLRRRRLAAADPAPPARAAGRARLDAPTPAPSSSSSCSATPTRRPGSKGYRDLEPANLYNVDYSLLGTARVEPLIRRIRNAMAAAGHGGRELQGRVQLRPARDQLPLRRRAARRPTSTSIYKNGAKEIAAQEGMAISFMAKFNEREGNSCHIHFSLADARGPAVRARPRGVRLVPRRAARVPARADAAAGAERQLLQALRARARSRRRRSPGATTTAPARCASSATGPRCASRTAPAAPT